MIGRSTGGTGSVPSQIFWDDTEVVLPYYQHVDAIGRKHPAHFPVTERFNTAVIVFLTVCTKNRKRILATNAAHELLKSAWQTRPTWLAGRYVIMPDHVHLFCAPNDVHALPLAQWVEFWKSHVAQKWFDRSHAPIWQRHFWDTQLRREENYDEKWGYVLQNPVRAGLVKRTQEWPFQGELNVLPW